MVSEKDCWHLSWEDFKKGMNKVVEEIKVFCTKEKIKIDYITPIMRGGATPAVVLAHKLDVIPMLPIQVTGARDESGKKYWKIFQNAYENKKDEKAVVLLVEGNHCSGGSANFCKNLILRHMPSAKIIYVSVGRDYTNRDSVKATIFDTFAFYTQESKPVDKELIERYNIVEKITIYPWELLENEVRDINKSIKAKEGK